MTRSVLTALVVSVAVHGLVGLGLSADQPVPSMRLGDAPILIGLGPDQSGERIGPTTPWRTSRLEPLLLSGWGHAKLRCRADGRGHLSACRWIEESGEGWGDEAVSQIDERQAYPYYAGRARGYVTFYMTVCGFGCPVS